MNVVQIVFNPAVGIRSTPHALSMRS